jgi:hypothetical protein
MEKLINLNNYLFKNARRHVTTQTALWEMQWSGHPTGNRRTAVSAIRAKHAVASDTGATGLEPATSGVTGFVLLEGR